MQALKGQRNRQCLNYTPIHYSHRGFRHASSLDQNELILNARKQTMTDGSQNALVERVHGFKKALCECYFRKLTSGKLLSVS